MAWALLNGYGSKPNGYLFGDDGLFFYFFFRFFFFFLIFLDFFLETRLWVKTLGTFLGMRRPSKNSLF